MNDKVLEQTYRENLEERLIVYIAEQNGFSLEKAMDLYYHSDLAEKIHQGTEGIQYLDYKVLAEILRDTEGHLFRETEKTGG